MRKVFWDNPYLTKLMTTVTSVNNNHILFNETIAYSFSGGQESDYAYINGLLVLSSQIVENYIYYVLPDHHGLAPGDQVCMEIDWQRRYKLMRLHFAAELVLELISRTSNIEKIGAHISPEKARIDFSCEKNISIFFEKILHEYNTIINSDKPIKTGFSDLNKKRRYWEIEGFSKISCGGTHVRSTAEVGLITLKRVNLGRGKERVEIKLVQV